MKFRTKHCVGCGGPAVVEAGYLKVGLANYAVPMDVTASWCSEKCHANAEYVDSPQFYGWLVVGDELVVTNLSNKD